MSLRSLYRLGVCLSLCGLAGCGSKDSPKSGEDQNGTDTNATRSNTLPELTPIQPITAEHQSKQGIRRNPSGSWIDNATGQLFTGTVVFDQDDLRWEEKYTRGTRTHVKEWDEDGLELILYSWNRDGSRKSKLNAEPPKR